MTGGPTAPKRRGEVCTWLGSPVVRMVGSLSEIDQELPEFDRRPFRVTTGLAALTGDNPNYDVIVRLPGGDYASEVPLGVVSKNYRLIPHREVLGIAVDGLKANGISATDVRCELNITQLGERMEIALMLPEEFSHDPGDGNSLGLRLHCTNSVDGTTRFSAFVGWLRFVCSNGMVVGTTTARVRRIHNRDLDPAEIATTIRKGIDRATQDRKRLHEWTRIPISSSRFQQWIDGDVRKTWGVKAATRAYHIVSQGMDVDLTMPFESAPPSQRSVAKVRRIPGTNLESRRTAFTVSQALSWLAADRRQVDERIAWMLQIPGLMQSLLARAPSPSRSNGHESGRT